MTISNQNPIEAIYTSAGCNRCAHALDWGGTGDDDEKGRIIFAQSQAVAIMSADEPYAIESTYSGHKDTVNCVRWIRPNLLDSYRSLLGNQDEFVSGSKDKTLAVWRKSNDKYECIQVLEGHKASVNVIDAVYIEDTDKGDLITYIVSASVDSTVRIWKRCSKSIEPDDSAKFVEEQVISSRANGFALALKFYRLPLSKITMLLMGFENNRIEVHVLSEQKEEGKRFECKNTLIGHEDWIRDLDVCQISPTQLLIASCSQDYYIRLWRLEAAPVKQQSLDSPVTNEPAAKPDDNDDDDDDEAKKPLNDEELKLKSSRFVVWSELASSHVEYTLSLESVLFGHEDWIYSVRFQPMRKSDPSQALTLISASMDKTLVVWTYNEENAVWIDVARAGDIGGTTLGFYGATFNPTGELIVAHGYQGALHMWRRDLESKSESLRPVVINAGHFDAVEDLSWEPDEQNYLISVSKDQTTRFHAIWRRENEKGEKRESWHELGRPQIHGYDLTCVSFVDRFRFVSGADEKVLRVFACPLVFLKNYFRLSDDSSVKDSIQAPPETMAQGASVPALGLSNKAVFDGSQSEKTPEKGPNLSEELYKEVYFNVIDLNTPPTEEHLLQNTLWPEMQKLYGHGFELFAVACETRSSLIASACKASKPDHARILLWEQQKPASSGSGGGLTFKQVASLPGHELTVVQMKFSHNGDYLLSVSRDRSWKLFQRRRDEESATVTWKLVSGLATKNSFHTRIVWSCDWSHDDKYFVTTSRDKRVCLWQTDEQINVDPEAPIVAKPIQLGKDHAWIDLSDAVTASAFAPDFVSDKKSYLLAFGLENGTIEFYSWSPGDEIRKYAQVERRFSPHLTVKRLSFRAKFDKASSPKKNGEKKNKAKMSKFCLAACSEDHSVRLYNILA